MFINTARRLKSLRTALCTNGYIDMYIVSQSADPNPFRGTAGIFNLYSLMKQLVLVFILFLNYTYTFSFTKKMKKMHVLAKNFIKAYLL